MKSSLKRRILLTLFFIAATALPLLAQTTEIRIAVLDFKANDTSKFSAIAVSEFIGIEMSKKKELTIIERSQIGSVLAEQGFQQTGCTDQSCAVEMGKLLSAKKIIIGTLNKTGKTYVITAKIVDVESGRVDAAETERCTKEDDFESASRILAVKLTNKIAGTSYSIPVRTYRQDEERNRFSLGLMYQFGLYPKYDMPSLVYDSSDAIHKFQGNETKILTHSLSLSAGYEFLHNFELKAEFNYMLAWEATEGECDTGAGSGGNYLNLTVDGRKSESYDLTIFPIYKYPLTGFQLFIAPGIGYRYNKQKEGYTLYVNYTDGSGSVTGEYLLKPRGYALLLKCEIGTSVYISRFVELIFSFGIDGQVYSNYYKNISIETISENFTGSPAYTVDKVINDSQNSAFLGYYIKGGFNIRVF